MSLKAYAFLADGFEEIEALATVDVLRRAEVDVTMVSVTPTLAVMGAHGIPVVADILLDGKDFPDADILFLPGGMPGASTLASCKELGDILLRAVSDGHTRIAAICAAPMVLGGLGILEGRKATCYPGFESYLKGAVTTGAQVEVDGLVTTGRGPGASLEFALRLVADLVGQDVADKLAEGMCVVR